MEDTCPHGTEVCARGRGGGDARTFILQEDSGVLASENKRSSGH